MPYSADEVPMAYRFVGTGFDVPDWWTHIGSCVTPDGALVWHVYGRPGSR